ncbi:MAG: hypothetical protein P4K86_12160 [Terracidiphilus sp.]|nr:hypothetical protein [Terracidiphilus sp.]MDR3777394.1 hypothetical protein [Terracidiphilus sp.]
MRLGDGISATSRLRDFAECGADLKKKAGFLTKNGSKTAKNGQKMGKIGALLRGVCAEKSSVCYSFRVGYMHM